MLEYENNSSVLELERKELTPLEAAEAYYFASRSIGLAEHGGAYFRNEVDVPPENYLRKQLSWLDEDDGFLNISAQGKAEIAREYQKACTGRDLLEDVAPTEDLDNPKMTVCIPVAINSESPERLHELLENAKKSQEDFGESTQIILWANTQSNAPEADAQTRANYEILRGIASEYSSPDLQIKIALDVIPPKDFSMSKLRQRYMDAFVGLAIEKEYEADHVITWLDADAVRLGEDYLGKLFDQTHGGELGFVHPRTDYAADWARGENKDTYDEATRAFLANEIINRAERGEPGADSYGYTEESGLTFTYLTFLLSGGCDTSNPVDESEALMNGLRTSTTLPIFESFQTLYETRTEEPLSIASPLAKEVVSARAALSGRRIYNNIKRYGVAAMPSDRLGGSVGGDYQLFTHDQPSDHEGFDSIAAQEHLENRRKNLKSSLARDSIGRVLQSLYGKK